MKKIGLNSIVALSSMLLSVSLSAQTAGTFTFVFTQVVHSPCFVASKNVMAVWIQTSTGTFVKTKLRNLGSGTKDHLPTWAVNAGGTAGNGMAAACSVVDATSGATLTSFGTKTIVWNGTDVTGALVPDGAYKVTIQSTWNHGTGSTVTTSFNFTKGIAADSQTPANTTSFTGISLNWVPDFSGVHDIASYDPAINVYPNPSNGVFDVSFNKATSIKVVDVLGATIFEEKIDANSVGIKSIDLSGFADGIYFVYVFDEEKSSKRKLILNK